MNLRRIGMIALCAGLPVSAALGRDRVEMKLKYLPGTYTVTMDNVMTTIVTVGDKDMPGQKMSMTMVIKMVVADAGGGKKNIDMTFNKIKMAMGEMKYDSSVPAEKQDEMMVKTYKGLLAAKLSMVLDADGKIVETKGFDKMFEGMGAAAEGLKGSFGDKAIRAMIEQQQKFLPGKAVGVGDNWEGKMSMPIPMLGDLDLKFDFKVKGTKDGVATLDFKGTVTKDQKSTTRMGSTQITIDAMKIAQSGEMTFDAKQGVFTGSKIDQDMTMDMSMPNPNGGAMKMTNKQSAKITTTTVFEPAK